MEDRQEEAGQGTEKVGLSPVCTSCQAGTSPTPQEALRKTGNPQGLGVGRRTLIPSSQRKELSIQPEFRKC